VLVLVAAPAAAKTVTFSGTYDGTLTTAPCGFDVQTRDAGKAMGRLFFAHDGTLVKVDVTNAGTTTLTNLTNGLSVTQDYQILFKNTNQTDLGNGLLAVDQTTVGAFTMRGPDGRVLLRGHGPESAHLVLDFNATSDADFVVSKDVYFSHGAHASDAAYCQALTAAIGPGATA
jgi:hypothetical protein